jgi:ribosomal protein L11 methyltransferase
MRAFRVVVPAAQEDAATAALWEQGTVGIEVRPAGAQVEMLAYFPDSARLPLLQAELPGAVLEPIPVPEVDWVARFREGFRPFQAGRFLIAPAWEAPRPSPDVLLVDPARAFGTGTHETTRLCLAALVHLAAQRPLGRTLDLGAGTGLLAAAAARLGAAPVIASDIDPEAISASRHHARLNEVPLHVVRADGGQAFRSGAFDLVLANLMALLLVDRAAEIRSLLAPQGALVLSGLLVDDVPHVRRAFAGCGTPLEHVDGEWAALVFDPVAAP